MKPNTPWILFLLSTCLVSGNVTQTPKRRPVFFPNSSNFEEITKCSGFVDKTLFIKAFFDFKKNNYHLITRPRKFGKSTNMDMLRCFVELEVNQENGQIIDQNQTSSYRLFTNTTLALHISQHKDIIEKYLAKYPVIHIEFRGIMRNALNETLKNLRERIRNTFLPYKWMINILRKQYERNNESSIGQQIRFMKKAIYGTLNLDYIMKSLYLLSKIILNHFRRNIFVFIDDYDEALDYGLRHAVDIKYDPGKIRYIMSNMFKLLFNEPLPHIEYMMITGIFHGMPSMFYSHDICLEHHHFLNCYDMSPYFGFTEDQVHYLLQRHRIDIDEWGKVNEYYNGYFNALGSVRLFNTYSILNYAASYKRRNVTYPLCWIDPGSLDFIIEVIKDAKVYVAWLRLLLEKYGEFNVQTYTSEQGLLKLSAQIRRKGILTRNNMVTFYWFCMENGYLSRTKSWMRQFIPNREVEIELTNVLFRFYDRYAWNELKPMGDTFKKLVDYKDIHDEVPKLRQHVEALLRSNFTFNLCKELHYFGLIYRAARMHFENVFVDIKVLNTDTAYYIVISMAESLTVIAVKYEHGIKKAIRQAFYYKTDKSITRGRIIRFIAIRIKFQTGVANIAYFVPYYRYAVEYAVESSERDASLYDVF